MARPTGGGGQEDILERWTAALTARVKNEGGLSRRETVEEQRWDTLRLFQGRVCVNRKEEGLRTAREWKDLSRTVWADRSRLENGRVGAAVAWWKNGGWAGGGTYLGTNKEVFGAEVFAILRAVRLLNEQGEEGQDYTVFSDSHEAVAKIQHGGCGPAQALARAVTNTTYELRQRNNSIAVRWTPEHSGRGGERACRCRGEAGGSRATTFSIDAGAGNQRSEGCDRESRRTASGSHPGPPPSASTSETSERLRPC